MRKTIHSLLALSSLAAFVPNLFAEGHLLDTPSPSMIANRTGTPENAITRILASRASGKKKLSALARFVRVGDSMAGLESRLGKPWDVTIFGERQIYTYKYLLQVECRSGRVVYIYDKCTALHE